MALSMQHCFHDLCMFRMSLSLLFKTYLAFGTLPTHLASRNARTAATAQRQPVNPRRQLQQQRLLCAITRPKNEHIRAMDRFMAQGAGGSGRPRHWSCRRGRSAHAACKHAVRVPASATRTATPSTCAQIHLRRVWPNAHGAVLFPPCTPEHYARQLHGSGHTRPLASAKNIQETNTRLHVQARQIGAGAVAVRAHRRCLCAYRG